MRTTILLCLLMVLYVAVNAQRDVYGMVRNQEGEALYGAIVGLQENVSVAASTAIDGSFKLHIPDNKAYTIKIIYYGYKQLVYKLQEDQSGKLDFTLEEDIYNLEQVVVTGTRTPKLLKDVPIVTKVISREDIVLQDAADIRDVLQTELPGVEFTYSMNQQVALNMSGFGGSSVLFLVDGERLAGETLDNIDYSRLSMDNVDRVEVVKGAASSLYGSNAVGGVVNIITNEPKEPWTLNLNAHYGSHNEQRYSGTLGLNGFGFTNLLSARYASCDPIALKNDGDYSEIYGYRSININDRFTYSYRNRFKITGKVGYFFRERDSQETSHDRYRDFSGSLKGEFTISTQDDITVAYNFDQYDKSSFALLDHLDVRNYSNVQNSLRAVYNHTFGKKHILTVGGDYLRDYLMSYQFEGDSAHHQHTADAFAQFDWNPLKQLNIIGGLRYDYYSDANLHHISPKLSAMYKWKDFSFRASYAAGFRAPTLKEMYMSFDMANVFMIYGNPDLQPEKSHNFGLSAEWGTRHYNITVMGFYNRVANRITTAWNSALNGMKYVNMAPLQIAGVDVSASANWDFGLCAKLSYVYTYEHIALGEPLLSSTRPHTATARLSYGKRWKNYQFNIALTGRWLSKVTCDEYTSLTDYTETEKVTYPGYTIWKLMLTQKIYKGLNLNCSIDNLFNYIPDYYYGNSPATTGTTFLVGVALDIERFFKK